MFKMIGFYNLLQFMTTTGLLCVFLANSLTIAQSNINGYPDDNHLEGPVILPKGKEVMLQKGDNYTMHCSGKRRIKLQQQHIPEDSPDMFTMVENSSVTNDTDYPYESTLNLYHVDEYAVGYYACFDDTVNVYEVLHISKEPSDSEHVTYVYVYVNGTNDFFAPLNDIVVVASGSEVVIECRPTMPDVKVTLTMNPRDESIEYSPKIGFLVKDSRNQLSYINCSATRGNETRSKLFRSIFNPQTPKPIINGGSNYFVRGETFSLNCSVEYQPNSATSLMWSPPNKEKTFKNDTNARDGAKDFLYTNLVVTNATKDDAGEYKCIAKSYFKENSTAFNKTYLETGLLEASGGRPVRVRSGKIVFFLVSYKSYPRANITCYKDSKTLLMDDKKYKLITKTNAVKLKINDARVEDIGNYTIELHNGFQKKSEVFNLEVESPPETTLNRNEYYGVLKNILYFSCDVTGYPLPSVKWSFVTTNASDEAKGEDTISSLYQITSILKMPMSSSGVINCIAENSLGNTSDSANLYVDEVDGGFGIKQRDNTWFAENEDASLKCLASKHRYKNATWYQYDFNDLQEHVTYTVNEYSYIAVLNFPSISISDTGNYTCYGEGENGDYESETIMITVAGARPLVIKEPNEERDLNVYVGTQEIQLVCVAEAVPRPVVEWYKDGELLSSDPFIISTDTTRTTVNSTLVIRGIKKEHIGKYECVAKNIRENESRFFNLKFDDTLRLTTPFIGVIVAVLIIFILVVVYLIWKVKKEKGLRKELAEAGLLYFKEGAIGSLNPDLLLDDQAELLPYDDRFEFPPEKLCFGAQLGHGAFGVVYKAEARGIVDAEKTTTVAVKTVEKTADNMYIKALASELKIMVHLGKHINIVNLLGACTKDVGKRQLMVILEYCKFGNLLKYLQKHRKVFIDQLTQNKENNFGRVNRGFSSSSANSGLHSDYYASNHTQATDNTSLNTINSSKSMRAGSDTDYVQPGWSSNYEADYIYDDRNPRPLCSRDLICWAFQIARGMEYLASRKVIHGDLAARNVLLAEDNIVKICDFGLARSIYKNDEYQKKENSPLPVKWLALECMIDRIFSTQSDVWAFGILLWELFSLAMTPYPNLSPRDLPEWLSQGRRLGRPTYANDRLYEIMRSCWEQKPTDRPSFSDLQDKLGALLEDNVRNHYIDLNQIYMDANEARKADGVEDYLEKVTAPDYNNIAPDPVHYVNQSSFNPPVLTHDDEGYLQMSPATNSAIFSPRTPATFEFDPRVFKNPSTEPNSHGELTPMLTLNNLPTRGGSESDCEGNTSPYLNMCPRIEEEDDVFENNKNITPKTSYDNAMYITITDKKPQDIINNAYVNVSAQNGLVK